MAESFKAGDVVRIKSGGPNMTVQEAGESAMTGQPFVTCVWFDAKGTKQQDSFSPESLEIARNEPHSGRVRPTNF